MAIMKKKVSIFKSVLDCFSLNHDMMKYSYSLLTIITFRSFGKLKFVFNLFLKWSPEYVYYYNLFASFFTKILFKQMEKYLKEKEYTI